MFFSQPAGSLYYFVKFYELVKSFNLHVRGYSLRTVTWYFPFVVEYYNHSYLIRNIRVGGLRTQHSDRAWGGLTLAQTWTQRFFCLFLPDPPAKLIQFVQSDPRQLGVHQRRHRAAQCSHPSVFSSWLGCCHLPALDMFPGVYLLSAVSCDSQGYFLPHLDYVTHFWCRECIHLSFVYWRSLMVCSAFAPAQIQAMTFGFFCQFWLPGPWVFWKSG